MGERGRVLGCEKGQAAAHKESRPSGPTLHGRDGTAPRIFTLLVPPLAGVPGGCGNLCSLEGQLGCSTFLFLAVLEGSGNGGHKNRQVES